MLNEIFYQPEMCPILFRKAWGLSVPQTACLLGITERSLYYYQKEGKDRRNPSPSVKIAAALWTQLWIAQGKKPEECSMIPPRLLDSQN